MGKTDMIEALNLAGTAQPSRARRHTIEVGDTRGNAFD
jgi:hypothetical protein